MSEQKFYKVLVDGRSCHGGNMEWSLPSKKEDGTYEPGSWHSVSGRVVVCSNGLHVTNKPTRWWKEGAVCYAVEVSGQTDSEYEGDDKIACEKVRLLHPLSNEELATVNIFVAGAHTVSEGDARADGNATVEAYGNATVRAYGNATVEAYGNATVNSYYNGLNCECCQNNAKVSVSGCAVHIDRRKTGKPEVITAEVASEQSS